MSRPAAKSDDRVVQLEPLAASSRTAVGYGACPAGLGDLSLILELKLEFFDHLSQSLSRKRIGRL
jgi:hypothetical protein